MGYSGTQVADRQFGAAPAAEVSCTKIAQAPVAVTVAVSVTCATNVNAPETVGVPVMAPVVPFSDSQIGRASCRERV